MKEPFCACAQPMRDDVTLQLCLSLAGYVHKITPAMPTQSTFSIANDSWVFIDAAFSSSVLCLIHLFLDEYGGDPAIRDISNMFGFWFGQYFLLKTSEYETYLYNRKKSKKKSCCKFWLFSVAKDVINCKAWSNICHSREWYIPQK